jgi:hypothetical protein
MPSAAPRVRPVAGPRACFDPRARAASIRAVQTVGSALGCPCRASPALLPGVAPGTVTGVVPFVPDITSPPSCPPWLPPPSPGITRLQRYHEGSDSRAWMRLPLCANFHTHPPRSAARVSSLHHRVKPGGRLPAPSGLSDSNHLTAPADRFATCPVSVEGFPFITGPGFAISPVARQTARPKRVCHPTDCPFASRCSPVPVDPLRGSTAVTQLRSATGRKPGSLKGTFTSLM